MIGIAATPAALRNAQGIPLTRIPILAFDLFRGGVVRDVAAGRRLSALFGYPSSAGRLWLVAVVSNPQLGTLAVSRSEVEDSFASLTPDCPQAHAFEREIAEQWAVTPTGHPWLKPLRFHRSYLPGADAWNRSAGTEILPSVMDFFRVEGEEVHEVAVGPVHASVIEPGHFRFQCHGENVLHLEISLGYQHRGVEKALRGGPGKRSLHYAETLAGDTTVGHAVAYCQALETLSGSAIPARAHAIRTIGLELERLANHTGDLGALAGDVGYLPTASFCGRLRGDFLNLTAHLCGNRFGRGLVRPGGATFDLDSARIQKVAEGLKSALADVRMAAELLWNTPSVMTRFEKTGTLTREQCVQLGLVGPPARSCGVVQDVRFDFPTGMYALAQVPVSTWPTGDVFARAYLRWLEIQRSAAYVEELLGTLPVGPVRADPGPLPPEQLVVSLVEGWRGEICHVAITDAQGRFAAYKIVDPSFHNWMGLALAMRNQQISDFPLCNKSFNLSYCGHDL